jgi:hypothetical protein
LWLLFMFCLPSCSSPLQKAWWTPSRCPILPEIVPSHPGKSPFNTLDSLVAFINLWWAPPVFICARHCSGDSAVAGQTRALTSWCLPSHAGDSQHLVSFQMLTSAIKKMGEGIKQILSTGKVLALIPSTPTKKKKKSKKTSRTCK